MLKTKLLAAAAAATCLTAAPAHAATFFWQFYDSSNVRTAWGSITASDTLNGVGGYDVQSIGGWLVGYGAITSLVANPNQPNPYNMGPFIFNNVVYSQSSLAVDYYGIVFTTATHTWNIFHDQGVDWLYGFNGGWVPSTGNYGVQGVPEPGTWALTILGFGAVGWGMRRRKQSVRVRYTMA